MSTWREQVPAQLAELGDYIEAVLRDLHLPPEQAAHAAFEIVRRFTVAAGGTSVYLPKIAHLLRYERDAEIYQAFTGGNVQALARKYGISEVWVYAILRRQRQLRRAKEQPLLPGFNT